MKPLEAEDSIQWLSNLLSCLKPLLQGHNLKQFSWISQKPHSEFINTPKQSNLIRLWGTDWL